MNHEHDCKCNPCDKSMQGVQGQQGIQGPRGQDGLQGPQETFKVHKYVSLEIAVNCGGDHPPPVVVVAPEFS